MFFPLGLGFRTKSFPYITWLIILACSLFYAVVQQRAAYEAEYMSLSGHDKVEQAHDRLFYDYCKKNYGGALCERFALERGLSLEGENRDPLLGLDLYHSPETLNQFAQVFEEFSLKLQKPDKPPKELRALPSFPQFKSSLDLLKAQTQTIRERYHLLHHDNMNLVALLTAIFSHDSMAHLVGNMLFLFIFGRYVEARVGHLPYLLAYLILGSAALASYAALSPQPFLHILGASANVSVLMGAFYALFFHQKLKIFFFYFAVKIVEFPVKTYMFLFFMLQEFIFSFTARDNVAYLAHAIGLVLGMGFGYVWAKIKPLPRAFLYEEEVSSWRKLELESDRSKFINGALEILKYNPNNKVVIRAVVNEIAPPGLDIAGMDLDEELLLRELMPGYLRDLYKSQELPLLYKTVEQIPHSWSMSVCLRKFSQKELLQLIDRAIDDKQLMASVLFIQAFVERYQRSPKTYNLLKTLKSVLNHMQLTENCRRHLSKIKDLSSSEGLRITINSRLIEEV